MRSFDANLVSLAAAPEKQEPVHNLRNARADRRIPEEQYNHFTGVLISGQTQTKKQSSGQKQENKTAEEKTDQKRNRKCATRPAGTQP